MDRRTLLFALALLAVVTLAGCTSGGGDADDDGLTDADEETPREIQVRTAEGVVLRNVTSDPNKVDTDRDGLNDFEELQKGTDPQDVDTDGDRLADGPNLTAPGPEFRTALEEADVIQRDGTWLGEADMCENRDLDPADWDSDTPQIDGKGDGLADGAEVQGWAAAPQGESYPVSSNPCMRDTDGDNLNDSVEKQRSTDPRKVDTEGDGIGDRLDADPLWDLSLDFSLETVELKEDMDTEGGADLKFSIQVAADRRTVWRNVTSTGTYDVDAAFESVEVDDQSPEYQAKTVQAFVQVVDVNTATEDEPVAITPDGSNTADLDIDILEGTARLGDDQVGSDGSGSTSGSQAAITFSYELVRG
jgi:hypothetical protein